MHGVGDQFPNPLVDDGITKKVIQRQRRFVPPVAINLFVASTKILVRVRRFAFHGSAPFALP